MRSFDLLLNTGVTFAAAAIFVRAGCMVNRLRWQVCPLLLSGYVLLCFSALCVALYPVYGEQARAIGYPGTMIAMALVLLLDRRLKQRLNLSAQPPGRIES